MRFDQFNEPVHETRAERLADWLIVLLACAVLVGFIVGAIP